jgi:hypothetical protein
MRLTTWIAVAAVALTITACQSATSADLKSAVTPGSTPSRGLTKTYTVSAPVRALVVTTSPLGGDITVTGSQRSTVQITVRSSYFTAPPRLRQSLSRGTLTLGYTCADCAVYYDIKVPHGVRVTATSYRGNLTLSSLSGDITAYTGTGNLTGTTLSCASARFRDDLGGISVSYSLPPTLIRASGSEAAISIRVPGDVAYDVHAPGADVTVRRSRTAAHVIDAQSSGGPIRIWTTAGPGGRDLAGRE